ncbi:MAG: hypothetical protein QXJ93_01915 [Candidatus Rehaiarchaeum fermentans]|nr:hypothetical protein [Candidatus Rehaiarchaeum fermentans]
METDESKESIPYSKSEELRVWRWLTKEPFKHDREKFADEILDRYFKGYDKIQESNKVPERQKIDFFWVANQLFLEAVECYREGYLEAAVILVRSALENAAYKITTRRPIHAQGWLSEACNLKYPSKGRLKKYKWEDLSEGLKYIGFDESQIQKIHKIVEKGNFVAHLLNKYDQYVKEFYELKPEEQQKEENWMKVKFGITKGEADEALEEGCTYMIEMRNKLFDFYHIY